MLLSPVNVLPASEPITTDWPPVVLATPARAPIKVLLPPELSAVGTSTFPAFNPNKVLSYIPVPTPVIFPPLP